jgi:type IX secretion system PorP/SprF family membrane protein
MKKLILLLTACALFTMNVAAQHLTSRYLFNNYFVNPAAATTHSNTWYLGSQQQWLGTNKMPSTYLMSYQQTVSDRVSLGGVLSTDNTGFFQTTQALLSYAYGVQLSSHTRLNFALAAKMSQIDADFSEAVLADPDDPLFYTFDSGTKGDVDFGLYLQKEKWNLGVVIPNLLQSSYKTSNAAVEPFKQQRSLRMHAAYQLNFSDKWSVVPSMMYDSYDEAMDMNALVKYKNLWQGGVSYKGSSIAILSSIRWKQLSVAYIYDSYSSQLGGAHELMLGYAQQMGESKKQRLERLKAERLAKKTRDTDGDGIVDVEDDCPHSYGPAENNGCPSIKEEYQAVLEEVINEIDFIDDEIAAASMPALMKLGHLLLKEKGLHLSVKAPWMQSKVLADYLLNRWHIAAERIKEEEATDFSLELFVK